MSESAMHGGGDAVSCRPSGEVRAPDTVNGSLSGAIRAPDTVDGSLSDAVRALASRPIAEPPKSPLHPVRASTSLTPTPATLLISRQVNPSASRSRRITTHAGMTSRGVRSLLHAVRPALE